MASANSKKRIMILSASAVEKSSSLDPSLTVLAALCRLFRGCPAALVLPEPDELMHIAVDGAKSDQSKYLMSN
jgi:hypothetical protein